MWICLNTRKSPKNFSRIQIKSLTLTHNGFSKTMQWDKGIEDYLFIIQNEVKNENPHEQNHLRFVPLKKIQEEYFSLYISNCLNKLTQWEAKNMGEMLWVSGILMGGVKRLSSYSWRGHASGNRFKSLQYAPGACLPSQRTRTQGGEATVCDRCLFN